MRSPASIPFRRSFMHAILATAALACSSVASGAADASSAAWSSDFAAATAQAREQGRAILLNFTGTDWCVWCHRLRDEVFVQKPFLDYAADALVLVEVDFPRRTQLPEAL